MTKKRTYAVMGAALALTLLLGGTAGADDPFAQGADALAVADSDGSSSLRAKLKLKKMEPDMVMIQVKGVDDSKFPDCIVAGRVLKEAKSKDKYFKLIGRGKTYKFAPVLKKKGKRVVLQDKMTQNNLGACYYPANTKLVIKVAGVDMKKKVFQAQEIYLK
jgi:hypothetical protein